MPFVSKAKGLSLAKIASRVMAGEKLSKFNLKDKSKGMFAVKEAVFPFNKFPNSDLLLGPEMKSTGEVMGFDKDFGMAFAKSQIAASNSLPKKGLAFISLKNALVLLSGFDSNVSRNINMEETITNTNRENLCFVPLLKKAERIAIPKSSRLVSIIHFHLL